MVPVVPSPVFDTVRSKTHSPRTPVSCPVQRCATVAADAIFSNVPDTMSFLPLSDAEADPAPATLGTGMPNAGTGARRPLNFSGLCAWRPAAISRLKIIAFFDVITYSVDGWPEIIGLRIHETENE